MGSLTARFVGFAIAILMILTGMMVLTILFAPVEEMDVEASMSPGKDAGGYMWVDSLSPEPTVEFDWIDAANNPNSEYLSEAYNYYYYYGNHYQDYTLPFEFPYYDGAYTDIKVLACGYLDVNGFQNNGYYYMGSTFPSPSYENGVIAAYAGYAGAYPYYGKGNFKIFALEGQTYGEKWVCFEWNKIYVPPFYANQGSSYEMTFEIILYESGLIKMQYLDADTAYTWYNNGQYAVCGIENADGTQGIAYSQYNNANLKSDLAVMFGKNLIEVDNVEVDTDEGGATYAQYRDYSLTAKIRHPVNNDMIRVLAVTVGNGLAEMIYFQSSDGSYYFTKDDVNGYIQINSQRSSVEIRDGWVYVNFVFSPNFAFPVITFQDLKVTALGAGAMPASMFIEDAFWVENRLQTTGSMIAYSESAGLIENGGWVKGGETFYFQGIKAVYPGTTLTPRPGGYSFTITDEVGNKYIQKDVQGYSNIEVVAENDLVKKEYTLDITDVPPGTDISDQIVFVMNIDPYRPTPPKDVLIHSDSYDDRNTNYDDDNEVFVSWEPSEDFESGISGYYVSTFDPFGEDIDLGEAIWVENPNTYARIVFEDFGARKVWVWAVDRAGNPSVPSYSITNIDSTEVKFSEFSPGNQVWVNTPTPVCSVLIDDGMGSGVSAKDLQYSTSTTNTLEYGAWRTSTLPRNADQLRLSVKTLFENGKNNWIRFRAKDVAGNGWTYSQDYNVWVDEQKPAFTNFRPFEIEYQNGKTVVVSVDITDTHDGKEGSGINLDTVDYRISTRGTSLYGEWMKAPISSIDREGVVHVEMELEFEEGTENYIQFRCYDNVGSFSRSKNYNILVNSAPVVNGFLSEPSNGYVYTTSEKILFDATKTVDNDGDELDFIWYSDINGFLSGAPSFFRTLSPGYHTITLVVNDPAHSVVQTWKIEVLEEKQIDPAEIDSDGDGIYDEWELRYGLDPNRPDSFIDSDNDKFTNLQEFQNGTDPIRSVSHPPYPDIADRTDPTQVDDSEEQYQSVTLALALVTLLIIIVLVLLAFGKKKNFDLEREEEKELEKDEIDYRRSLKK